MESFSDKVVILTGSTRGIGLASAKYLADRGASVVISSRKEESCSAAVEEITAQGGTAIAVPCHVGKDEQLKRLVDKTVERFGRVDGLVCNAASNPVYGPSKEVDYAAFELIFKNNVFSAQRLAFMASEAMPKGGSIVIVSSIAGMMGSRMIGAYGASKAAQMQVVRNLSLELGAKGIRVNGLAPGLIETRFSEALLNNPKMAERLRSQTALGRVGQPEEMAGAIAFLLSDAASYVTGQILIADGGATISDPF